MEDIVLEKARYEIGEISKKTGKKKVAEGVWAFPGKEKGAKKEGDPKKIKPRKNGPSSKEIGKGEYSIQSKGGHVKVPGKQVKIDPNHHTFAFKQGGQVKIADAHTGKVIAQGEDAKDAISSAKMMLSHPEYEGSKKEHMGKKGASPGFQKSPEEEKVSGELEKQKATNEKLTSQVSEMQGQMKKMESMMKQMQSGVKAGEKVGGTVAKPDVKKVVDTSLEVGENIYKNDKRKSKLVNEVRDYFGNDENKIVNDEKVWSQKEVEEDDPDGSFIKISEKGDGYFMHELDVKNVMKEKKDAIEEKKSQEKKI